MIIENGKGIEVNTAGLKYGMSDPNPHHEIIKRYMELGGEIITIGSDAIVQNIWLMIFVNYLIFCLILEFVIIPSFEIRNLNSLSYEFLCIKRNETIGS